MISVGIIDSDITRWLQVDPSIDSLMTWKWALSPDAMSRWPKSKIPDLLRAGMLTTLTREASTLARKHGERLTFQALLETAKSGGITSGSLFFRARAYNHFVQRLRGEDGVLVDGLDFASAPTEQCGPYWRGVLGGCGVFAVGPEMMGILPESGDDDDVCFYVKPGQIVWNAEDMMAESSEKTGLSSTWEMGILWRWAR